MYYYNQFVTGNPQPVPALYIPNPQQYQIGPQYYGSPYMRLPSPLSLAINIQPQCVVQTPHKSFQDPSVGGFPQIERRSSNNNDHQSEEEKIKKKENEISAKIKIKKGSNQRNVYKFIIRMMHGFVKDNKEELRTSLAKINYSKEEIDRALNKISNLYDQEREHGEKKRSQSVIQRIVKNITILTYVLKSVITNTLDRLSRGEWGKIRSKNRSAYLEVLSSINDQITVELPK